MGTSLGEQDVYKRQSLHGLLSQSFSIFPNWKSNDMSVLIFARVGEHIEERRLPQRDGERRLQRVVEYRITRTVGKIGENDGVFLGQAGRGLA